MAILRKKRGLVCFVLEPFVRLDSVRQREIDLVFEEIIEPAIDGHQFRIMRSSDLRRGEYVTIDHERLAKEEALMIANLTHRDPMVFYCLAARLAARPDLPHLILNRHDQNDRNGQNCMIEQPVLRQKQVFYEITPDAQANGEPLSEQEERESVRRKLHVARRDLTTMVENLLDDARYSKLWGEDDPGSPGGAAAPQPVPPSPNTPLPPATSQELVDSLVHALVKSSGQNANTREMGALGNITSGLFRAMNSWPNGGG